MECGHQFDVRGGDDRDDAERRMHEMPPFVHEFCHVDNRVVSLERAFFCFLFGSTTPFTSDELMTLYPTHDDDVKQVKASAEKTRKAGFILEPEEHGFVTDAEAAAVPN